MTPPVWVTELAARFWAAAGPPPPFPRDLAAAAEAGLPLRVVRLAGLSVAAVDAWLIRCRLPGLGGERDRRLRACVVCRSGYAFAFVDPTDPPAEIRFSVAHEVSHYLRDYDAPRRAAARVGPRALEVLDGTRPATAEERLAAVLRGVPLAAHVHLMERDDAGRPASPEERAAELAADRLAYELLAPAGCFEPGEAREVIRLRLVGECGLPDGPAADCAALLAPPAPPLEPFLARLLK